MIITRRTALAGAAAALAPLPARAQTRDLSSDIALLREAYETLHPGLYRYATPAQISARFDALARDWRSTPDLPGAYLSLSRFLATIRCGHTYANFYNQSDAVCAALFDASPRLPFHFAWLDDRMVIVANHSGVARLAPGTEVLSIDGVAARRILRTLMPYARADGANDDKRRALLEVRGLDSYETFDIFYGLVFRPGPRFRLRVKAPGGETTILDVPAIDLAARRAVMTPDAGDGPAWTLTYPAAATARLEMPTWALYNSKWDWYGFLDASFAEMETRGVTRLIVDLRGNEGGNDCGDPILARLIDAPLPREGSQRRTRYRKTPDTLNRYLDTWDRSFRDWGDDATPRADGFYDLKGAVEDDGIAPKGPRFRGDVLVLIDAQNSSATFQFANAIQKNRLGRLVGQPTGGNLRGINGGAFFFLRLPASGLEADLPLIARFPPTPQPDRGLTPDVTVPLTARDIAQGHDRVLEVALGLPARI